MSKIFNKYYDQKNLKILKNNQLNSKLRNLDWLLVFIVLLIGTISLLTIYSSEIMVNIIILKNIQLGFCSLLFC